MGDYGKRSLLKQAVVTGLVVQVLGLFVAVNVMDFGVLLKLTFYSIFIFWVAVFVVFVLRTLQEDQVITDVDLYIVKYGFIPLAAAMPYLNTWVASLKGIRF